MNMVSSNFRARISEKQKNSSWATGIYLFGVTIGTLAFFHHRNTENNGYEALGRSGRSSIGFIYKGPLNRSVKIPNSYNALDCLNSSNLTKTDIYTEIMSEIDCSDGSCENIQELTFKVGLPVCTRTGTNEYCGVKWDASTKVLTRGCYVDKTCETGECWFGSRVNSNYFDEIELETLEYNNNLEIFWVVLMLIVAFVVYLWILRTLINDKEMVNNDKNAANARNAEVI